KTGWLSKLGKDYHGEVIINHMKKEHVDFLGPRVMGKSGYSVILDSMTHDRTILTYRGVNAELSPSQVPFKRLRTRWFYFCTMTGTSFKALEGIAGYARKNNIPYAFNPSSYLTEKGARHLGKILKGAAIFILNKEEAEMLVGNGSCLSLVKKLHELGPKTVVITDGSREVVCYHQDHTYHLKPKKARVVECTGAGDAFGSTFVAGMIRRNDPQFAMRLATVNAASVISHYGAKNRLLSWRQALEGVKRYSCKKKKCL
ncbi:MAG: carbohydrate kinase family protein, partial [Nanoarchaeota archaeon]